MAPPRHMPMLGEMELSKVSAAIGQCPDCFEEGFAEGVLVVRSRYRNEGPVDVTDVGSLLLGVVAFGEHSWPETPTYARIAQAAGQVLGAVTAVYDGRGGKNILQNPEERTSDV